MLVFKGIKNNSLQKKLLIAVLTVIIIPFLIITIFSYKLSEDIIKSKINVSVSKTLSQVSYNIQYMIDEIGSASSIISQDTSVVEILSKKNIEDFNEQIMNEIKIKNVCNNIKRNMVSVNANILILGANGNVFSTYFVENNKSILSKPWVQEITNRNGHYYWFNFNEKDLDVIPDIGENPTDDDKVIAMGRLIKGRSLINCGIIVVAINETEICRITNKTDLTEGIDRFIVDNEGTIISHMDKKLIFKNIKNDTALKNVFEGDKGFYVYNDGMAKNQVYFQTIPNVGWRLVEQVPYNWLIKEIKDLRLKIFVIYGILFISFTVIIYFIIRKFLAPVKFLQKLMLKVENGDLDSRFSLKLKDEIGMLGVSFNSMVDNIKILLEENYTKQQEIYEQEKTAAILRYRVLQSQINPHFLFNTLNSIKWMAIINNANNIADNISALGHLLEASVKRAEDEITVEEELLYLKDYIQIMRLRYANNFDVIFSINEKTLKCRILKLLLQPIIENSLIHGTSQKKLNIQISDYMINNELIFEIKDDGVGIEKELLEKLLMEDTEKGPKKYNSLGIYSINQRIKVQYGSQFGLSIESLQGEGTLVKLTIPVFKEIDANVQSTDC